MNYITILFKKIKGFLNYKTISRNLFSVVSESEYKFVIKKIMDLHKLEHLDRSFLI